MNQAREFNSFLPSSARYSREAYVKAYKNLGFYDICDCDEGPVDKHVRPDSGNPGQLECLVCHSLAYPFLAIYPCDECTEPTLSDKYPLYPSDPFYCTECKPDH
jgi:hypothetical protein